MPVILITGHGELNAAIEAIRIGAYDFITKPFQDTVVLAAIHRALEKMRLERELQAAQKLAVIGTLAAGIAHELNTPLNAIIGAAERLLKRLSTSPDTILQPAFDMDKEHETSQKYLDMIQRNGLRCAKIVKALKTYTHNDPLELEEWNLNDIMQDSLILIEHSLKVNSNINIETDFAPELPNLRCDRNKLTQVFINLLTNAGDAMPYGGHINIVTQLGLDGKSLVVKVADEGSGIPPEVQARIFDPFFTTKPVGQGTGLGLSIVAGILREHQGGIEVESQPGKGTTFIITLQLFKGQDISIPSLPALGRYDKD
jgi:signal transduction histidine kinase